MKKIARSSQTRKEPFSGTIFVGVDVHKKSYSVSIIDEEGRCKTFLMAAEPFELVKLLLHTGCVAGQVAYEAGPCGFGLCRLLRANGFPATVVAPTRMPRPITRTGKTDRLDSLKLAEYAARGMLAPVRIPSEKEEGIRRLQRRRHKLTDLLRKNKQEIKSLLLENHIPEPHGLEHWSKAALKALDLDFDTKMTLESLLREQEFVLAERAQADEAVDKSLSPKQRKSVASLQSVPGAGPTLSRTFVTEIFQPERFPDSDHLASFLGLAPIVSQSGQGNARSSIVKNGQMRLRSLLIECAWKHKPGDWHREALYKRVLAASGVAQKAITAVARRLGILLWRLLVENRIYRQAEIVSSN